MKKGLLVILVLLVFTAASMSSVIGYETPDNDTRQGGDGSLQYYIDNGMGRNVFKLFSESKYETNWRLTDEWPSNLGSNHVNAADLRSTYDSAESAMLFNFPFDLYPLGGLTSQYEPDVTPYVNFTVNTNYQLGKVIHVEIRFDTNGDGTIETKALFNSFTTVNDPQQGFHEEYIKQYSTGYTNGTPGNMNDGMIQIAFWRTDGIIDQPGNAIDEDWCTIYCGAYSKWSWVALPYKWENINPFAVIKPDNYEDPMNWWLDPPDDPSSPHYYGYVSNQSIQMDASDSYSPLGLDLSYEWNFGDTALYPGGSNPNHMEGEVVEHWYQRPGIYYIQLKATDTNDRLGWTDHWIRVSEIPPDDTEPPTLISDNSPVEGTTNDEFQFDVIVDDNVGIKTVSIIWSHDTEGDEISLDKVDDCWLGTITLADNTADLTYTISVIDRYDNPFTSSERTLDVIDNDPPELIEDRTSDVCGTGQKLNFSIDIADNLDIESAWVKYTTDLENYSAEMLEQESETTWIGALIVPMDATYFHYYYLIEDISGNELNTTLTDGERDVNVIDVVEPTAACPEDVFIDQHGNVTFNGSKSGDNIGIVSYMWTFTYDGSKQEFDEMVEVFTFDIAGVYNITLTVTDQEGNVGTDYFTIAVKDTTFPSAIIGSIRDKDEGSIITFDGTQSTDDVGIVNYTWSFQYNGSTRFLYDVSPDFLFDTPGAYNITLIVLDYEGNIDRDFALITIKDITGPTANITALDRFIVDNDRFEIKKGTNVDLDASKSIDNVGVSNWTWTIKSKYGTIELFDEEERYIFDKEGVYTITLTITDASGNSDEISYKFDVKEPPTNNSKEKGGSILPIWLIISIIIIIVALGIIVGLIIFVRGRGKRRKMEAEEPLPEEPLHPPVSVRDDTHIPDDYS